jgi:hypothetical protein
VFEALAVAERRKDPPFTRWARGISCALLLLLPVIALSPCVGLVLYVVLPYEKSLYADGFSFEKLDKVKEGMTKEQVLKLLGEPLRTEDIEGVGGEVLIYADRDPAHPNADYWYVRVLIGHAGRVEEKSKSFSGG